MAASWTSAVEVVCDGVLGNSGEQGAGLVRFGEQGARGIGVAVDRFGSLWDRAGKGVLNRYASDGRSLRLLVRGRVDQRSNLDKRAIIWTDLAKNLAPRTSHLAPR